MKINDKISPCYGSDCEKCLKEDNNITEYLELIRNVDYGKFNSYDDESDD